MQQTQLSNVQRNTVSFTIRDPSGRDIPLDGVPVWDVEDPTFLSVVPAPDGRSAEIVTTGVVGTTLVNVTVDADLTAGQLNYVGTFEVVVTDSGEVSFTFSFGTPTRR